jgi:U1 small nuclear ribonucleoprotein
MTQFLPPNLLLLFQPRPPITYLAPIDKPKLPPYSGVAQFVNQFEDPATVDYSKFRPIETKDQRRDRKRKERQTAEEEKIQKILATWDPHKSTKATGDAYKTLFVSRVNYDTAESKIKREFEEYGPIKKVRVVTDIKTGKPRGYAFIEFEKERDMRTAYKLADGKKVDGRRVLVDVERGRTVKGWKPRRLGGGLGSTRAGGEDVNQKWSGREPPSAHEEAMRRMEDKNDKEKERMDREKTERGGVGGGGGAAAAGAGGYRGDRERDRGDRGDRGRGGERERDRGDRGDRGERDGYRERERDRDRGDRGGDDRGDRYRERERDRERDRR